MVMRYRFIVIFALAVMLAGCGTGTWGSLNQEVQAVEGTEVSVTLRYIDTNRVGPDYTLTLTLPEEWAGKFQTRNRRNTVIFEYIGERRAHPIFTIDALSNAQYWNQIGSLPGQFTAFANTADTYLIYHVPIDAFHSGLPAAEFRALAAQVPDLIATHTLARVR